MEYYVLQILGDVEPVLHGAYHDEDERDKMARLLKSQDEDSGLYMLNVTEGAEVEVDCYSGGFFEC